MGKGCGGFGGLWLHPFVFFHNVKFMRVSSRPGSCAAAFLFRVGMLAVIFYAGIFLQPGLRAEDVQADRVRVGVVLSGGGARGAAHVGVLRVLEEMRVPVDCIAGTSMGAIVGGLYAMGMPLDEIARITTQVDWQEIFTDEIPRRQVMHRNKSDTCPYITHMDFDLAEGVHLPMGIISGKRVDLFLRSLTLKAPENFDALPIPFRAVATDIVTGDPVVLSRGDLARALRASMAIPGAVPPVHMEGRLLVDGGVSRNLPIETVRAMGADVVIAVNIGTPLSREEDLKSFLSIIDQTTNILTNRNVQAQVNQLTDRDLVIEPDLTGITTASFDRMADAILAGAAAAHDRGEELRRYALDEEQYRLFRESCRSRAVPATSIEFVRMEQKDLLASGFFLRLVGIRPQNVLEKQILAKDIFELYKRDDLEDIDFRVVEENGREGLLVSAREKGTVLHSLDIGMELSSDMDKDNSYQLLLKYTMSRVNSLGGQWKNEFWLGQDERYFTEFYQPLSAYAWHMFVAPYAEHRDDLVNIYLTYDSDTPFARYQLTQSSAGMDLGVQMGEYGGMRLGYVWGRSKASLDTGMQVLPTIRRDEGAYRIRFDVDQLDSPYFPRDGVRFDGGYLYGRKHLGSDENYEALETALTGALSYGRHAVILRARADSNFGTTDTLSHGFFLGGLFELSGLNTNQLYGNHVLFGGIIYSYRIMELPAFLGRGLYAGLSCEAGNAWQDRSEIAADDVIEAGSLFVIADSKLGPLYIGMGRAEHGATAAYFSLGVIRF